MCRAYEIYDDQNDQLASYALCPHSKINRLRPPWNVSCFLLNMFLPGTGTIISAFACVRQVRTNKKGEVQSQSGSNPFVVADGLLQLLFAPLVVGWIWSVLFGWALYQKGQQEPVIEEFQ